MRAASSTTLTSSANPSTFGQPVTFTAAVTSAGGTPTGNVTFSSDGTALGTVVLTGGQATLTTSALPAGARTITADYAGNPTVVPSTGTLTQPVNTAATTIVLTSSTNPSLPGQAVTFTATVTSPAGTPTGTVTFASDGNALGTGGLSGGQATLTTSALAVGDHTIAAAYTPDANFVATSTTLTFAVDGITVVTRNDSQLAPDYTQAQLRAIYECTAAGTISNPPTILPLLPQPGSDARAIFLQTIANPGDAPVTPGPCVSDRDPTNPNIGLIENSGDRLNDPRQIAPYSVAQFRAQYYGVSTPLQGSAELRRINGLPARL